MATKRGGTVDDEDLRPLVEESDDEDNSSSNNDDVVDLKIHASSMTQFSVSYYAVVPILFIVFVFGRRLMNVSGVPFLEQKCPSMCESVDLSDTDVMLKRATEQRDALVQDLKIKYGEEYFPLFFKDEQGISIGKTGFKGTGDGDVSRKRYVRKLMLKLLQVQLANKKGFCDCSDEPFPSFGKFVWVNGGHSSAAGHGNRLNETYTQIMEQSAKPIYEAVGLDLIGRNHAMGGMSSSPELALCQEAVYGVDADLITWNFGMTDGYEFWRHSLYGNRRGAHKNRPLLLDIDLGTGHPLKQRLKVMKELEESGLATMYMNVSYFYAPTDSMPDMQNKTTEEEINSVPEYLRHFRCGEGLEKGEPLCDKMKYTDECAPKKAPWHPGWKANALNGNILAIFMVDLLLEALEELGRHGEKDKQAHFDLLKEAEDKDYENFFGSDYPSQQFIDNFWNATVIDQDPNPVFRDPLLCHTALLPAETRYRGILTESTEWSSFEHHDFGIERKQANELDPSDKSEMELVFDDKVECPIPVAKIDYKDYFFTTSKSGKTSLTFPNKAEKEAYVPEGHEFRGMLVVCFVKCDWGRCPQGNMNHEHVNGGNATLLVNGKRVESMVPIDDCSLLKGKQGFIWKADESGEFKLTAEIHSPDSYMRITSVILV